MLIDAVRFVLSAPIVGLGFLLHFCGVVLGAVGHWINGGPQDAYGFWKRWL